MDRFIDSWRSRPSDYEEPNRLTVLDSESFLDAVCCGNLTPGLGNEFMF